MTVMGRTMKQVWQHLPIKQKLIWITMLAAGSALLLAAAAFLTYDMTTYRQSLASDLLLRLKVLEINNAAPLAFRDRAAAQENLIPLRADPRLVAAVIYDKAGLLFAEYRRSPDVVVPPYRTDEKEVRFEGNTIDLYLPVLLDHDVIGHIAIRADLTEQQTRLRSLLLIGAGVLGVSFALAFFIASRLQASISGPITDLTRVARRVSQDKDYTVQAVKRGDDEIGLLADGLNEMLAQIHERDRQLRDTVEQLQVEIAERQLTERALDQSEEQFAKAFRASPNPVGITEIATGRTIDVNDACLALFGYPREEVIGRTTLMLGIWPDPEDRRRLIEQVQSGKPVLNREMTCRMKSGSLRHILVSSDLIELNGVACLITVGNDITDRKEAEAALQASQDQIQQMQKMEALGQLAGGIAHDFNNILTAILGNAEIACAKSADDHPSRPNLARIIEGGQRASHVVQQILTFTRQQDVSRTVLPLSPVVTEALALLRATLPAGVELTSTVDAATPHVLANGTQLHQVLMNLCTNAWHALGDHPGRITVDLAPVTLAQPLHSLHVTLPPGRYARLSVRDTGCGMSRETMARIFDPFFTTKPLGQGTGLGLSVVHGIVQGHDGTIVVESAQGQGTAFHLYFPAVEAPAPAHEPAKASQAARPGRTCRLLYLDDEEMLVELVRALFEPQGYQVTGCTKPAEALALVRANPDGFDAVVTDYNMPELSGLDVAREVMKICATLPVVLVSGYLTPAEQASVLAAGVKETIPKPTMLQELGAVLTRLLDSRS
ncbi:MAG: ATP-binding protein [Nitrospira sp.]|jgi:PAS domain S-box-containing protein|nr:ATP-binding protein [Nitrospira sp.]